MHKTDARRHAPNQQDERIKRRRGMEWAGMEMCEAGVRSERRTAGVGADELRPSSEGTLVRKVRKQSGHNLKTQARYQSRQVSPISTSDDISGCTTGAKATLPSNAASRPMARRRNKKYSAPTAARTPTLT